MKNYILEIYMFKIIKRIYVIQTTKLCMHGKTKRNEHDSQNAHKLMEYNKHEYQFKHPITN